MMWADHGDEISCQYAGTGAMKSAFTRTGKRDIWGLLDDGNKSLTRWVGGRWRGGGSFNSWRGRAVGPGLHTLQRRELDQRALV